MNVRRNTFFDRWASAQLGISADELSLAQLERLPVPTDLPDGPHSEMGYTESELLELAGLGDQLLDELPPLPKGYWPRRLRNPRSPSGPSPEDRGGRSVRTRVERISSIRRHLGPLLQQGGAPG